MACGRIPDSDNLFRLCRHPVAFNGGVFVNQRFWHLEYKNGVLHGSLVWERYAPTAEYVHTLGCRMASTTNEKRRRAGRLKDRDRHVYCGAYQLTGRLVRALATTPGLYEVATADVVHQIEDGEIAHTDLRIVLKPGAFNVEATKTAIGDRLWNACRGPLKHVCDSDKERNPHPSSTLNPPPDGIYLDHRSHLRQRWSIFRYRVFSWVWQNSIRAAVLHPDTRSRAVRLWSTIKLHACGWLWRSLTGHPA
jgi:hypothetical protein